MDCESCGKASHQPILSTLTPLLRVMHISMKGHPARVRPLLLEATQPSPLIIYFYYLRKQVSDDKSSTTLVCITIIFMFCTHGFNRLWFSPPSFCRPCRPFSHCCPTTSTAGVGQRWAMIKIGKINDCHRQESQSRTCIAWYDKCSKSVLRVSSTIRFCSNHSQLWRHEQVQNSWSAPSIVQGSLESCVLAAHRCSFLVANS